MMIPTKSSFATSSVEQSMISVKSESFMPNRIMTQIDKDLFEKKCNHRKNKSLVRRLGIGIICCVLISCCFTTTIESARLIYKRKILTNNSTVYLVEPPAFTTYFSMLLMILFLPIHFYMECMKKEEKKISLLDNIKKNVWVMPREYYHWSRSLIVFVALLLLWNSMVYCFIRSAQTISGLDIAVIFCTNSPLSYLLFWVILHKKFIATRIIAFIIGSSGVIINIYSDMSNLWFKVLITASAVAFSMIGVILRYLQIINSLKDNVVVYGILGFINTLVLWPVFISLSVLTSVESIVWTELSWGFLFGIAFGLVGTYVTLEIAGLYTTRFTRTLHFLLAIPLTYFVDTFWIHHSVTIPHSTMEIISYVLISLSVAMNSVPHQFINQFHHRFFPQKVTRQTTGRRVSLSARSHLMENGGGGGALHSSFNQSHHQTGFIEMKSNQR